MITQRLVYTGDIMERAKAYVLPSDLPDALKLFKEKTGTDATIVEVAEKIVRSLEDVIPEGIELLPHGGVLTFEIWLSAPEVKEKAKPVVIIEKTESQSPVEELTPVVTPLTTPFCINDEPLHTTPIYAKSLSSTKKGRGRPKKELQANFLDILSDKDMNLEEKSKILGIHFTTVQRRMKNLGIQRKGKAEVSK